MKGIEAMGSVPNGSFDEWHRWLECFSSRNVPISILYGSHICEIKFACNMPKGVYDVSIKYEDPS